ncbi:MAG: TonB-dependent receptor [Oxalobacteraceae bacterium]|nr:TonB-dependent receptor [Oxalobacteraceae bacterium]
MNLRKNFLAHSIACAIAGTAVTAHSQEQSPTKSLAPIIVTADPFGASENAMILAPAKVLSGDELRNKLGSSLGDTLGNELGVNASGFSTGASRPIIRGLEGPRVKILQNGMSTGDLSAISNDHAVGSGMMSATQIEILRGPAALLYGSGAIGGLVNIVNGRIPTVLEARATGESELRYSSVDQGTGLSFSADRSAGNIGLHVDGNVMNAGDYRIPGSSAVDASAANNDTGKLGFSRNRENNIAVGGSLIQDWGHVGASLSQLGKVYGIHGRDELAKIDLAQTRFDVDSFIKSPLEGFDGLRVKLGQTDYRHTELENSGTDPHVRFSNKSFESRWELSHLPIAGWRGKFGLQTEHANVQALNLDGDDPTVPRTRSQSTAGFIVEERDFGDLRVNVGGRFESISRRPLMDTKRSFKLGSYSAGVLWAFMPGYGIGATASVAQRAPTPEELYSGGAHHPTETYDIGDANLKKETSKNIDLSLQKTAQALRWKANVFQNKVKNFVYGSLSPAVQGIADGMEFDRTFSQADATLRGVEAELSYNYYDPGWFGRVFADTSRGTLDNLGNLPLQPSTRTGLSFGYQDSQWRSSLSVLHASAHNRIAGSGISEETTTPAYTRVDASINYVQRYGTTDVTWFLLARNLLNEEIRLSTSLLKDYLPQPGRNLMVGLRTRF